MEKLIIYLYLPLQINKTKYGPDMTASVENSILSTYKTLCVIVVTLN